jgi:hypothetical protein
MNTVILNNEEKHLRITLSELMSGEYKNETAFIGKCGDGLDNALYLLCYGTIVEAKNPRYTWDSDDCSVEIHRFVDVDITVREKK